MRRTLATAAVLVVVMAVGGALYLLLRDSDDEPGWTSASGRAVEGSTCAELPEPDFGFSRLPPIREPSFDIASPHRWPAVRLEGVDGRLVRPGQYYGVTLADNTRPPITRDWRIKGWMRALDERGRVVDEVSHDRLPVTGRSATPSLRMRVGDDPGFYRLDLRVAGAGRWSGRYSIYLKAVPPHGEARLAIGGDRFRPGQSIGVRVENLGSEPIQHGYGTGLERYEDGDWMPVHEKRVEPLIAYGLQGGGVGVCRPVELPPDLKPGRYRLNKTVSTLKEPRGWHDHLLTAEFEVAAPPQRK